jgi:hypothetical protein
MKSFKEHLVESKQVYDFKIKIAGDTCPTVIDKLKRGLERFSVESFSSGKSTPIQETQVDFPDHKNVGVTVYDVVLTYPTTSKQVQDIVAEALGISHGCVKVRNLREQEEELLNHAYDNLDRSSTLLGSDYEKSNNQDIVGDAHMMTLLKELTKMKHQGEQYKGVNDKLLAKKVPVTKNPGPAKVDKKIGTVSPIGSKQVTLPTAKLGR